MFILVANIDTHIIYLVLVRETFIIYSRFYMWIKITQRYIYTYHITLSHDKIHGADTEFEGRGGGALGIWLASL